MSLVRDLFGPKLARGSVCLVRSGIQRVVLTTVVQYMSGDHVAVAFRN